MYTSGEVIKMKQIKIPIDKDCEHCERATLYFERITKEQLTKNDEIKLVLIPDINVSGIRTHFHLVDVFISKEGE